MTSFQRTTEILKEVALGVKPPANENKEDALVRRRLQKQVNEIHAKGGVVEIPPEGP